MQILCLCCESRWPTIVILALLVFPCTLIESCNAQPGDVLTITASANNGGVLTRAEVKLVVLNPVFTQRVFYICNFGPGCIAGIRTRFIQHVDSETTICEGVTTRNGTIFYKGQEITP